MRITFRFSCFFIIVLVMAAFALTLYNFSHYLPLSEGWSVLHGTQRDNIAERVFYYSLLPRLAISLLAGAGFSLTGVLFQQILRNPLAESGTLGVAGGAQLGMTAMMLWASPGGGLTPQLAAVAGAMLVGVLVFGIAWGKRLSPVTLILAGLVLSLYCGALSQMLAIFHREQLQSLFLWGTGTLNQTDWRNVAFLWPRLLTGLLLTLLLLRPLTLMGLDDNVARNLGLSLSLMRLLSLMLAILLSAYLVSVVGLIGFIGLFAPLLARMLGARRLLSRILLAMLLGALLLWLADQCVLWLSGVWREMSTGTMTALLGGPLLLWLLPRLHTGSVPPVLVRQNNMLTERRHTVLWALVGLGILLLLVMVALSFGRASDGWRWSSGALWQQLIEWRAPRVVAALTAGIMLGIAGSVIQRLCGNPMASPEVLGISSGAASGVMIMLLFVPGDAFGWQLTSASLGAAVTLLLIIVLSQRNGFTPSRMLLTGMALSTAFSALLVMLLASGDPRMAGMLTWLSGSTYHVDAQQAWRAVVVMLTLLLIVPLVSRWLTILPLGEMTARSLGLALTPSRLSLLLLAAVLTAMATLTVGPLSFVGLMAPHMARMFGFRRAVAQWLIAALCGGALMVLADWCGRMWLFPYQMPAGLLAAFIGAPYFIWQLRKAP